MLPSPLLFGGLNSPGVQLSPLQGLQFAWPIPQQIAMQSHETAPVQIPNAQYTPNSIVQQIPNNPPTAATPTASVGGVSSDVGNDPKMKGPMKRTDANEQELNNSTKRARI
jgi:hypothetical protein